MIFGGMAGLGPQITATQLIITPIAVTVEVPADIIEVSVELPE